MKAWQLLEKSGWCRGYTQKVGSDGKISFCLLGAVQEVYGLKVGVYAVQKLRTTLGTLFLASWNDRPGRTKAEVVDLLKKANV